MKLNEMLAKFRELSDEEKTTITGYANKKGEYGLMNCFLLQQQGAPQGEFIAMSELRKGAYNFRGSKVYFVVKPTIKENALGEEEFRGRAGYGKVVHISQVQAK